jgi:hypothetical protein
MDIEIIIENLKKNYDISPSNSYAYICGLIWNRLTEEQLTSLLEMSQRENEDGN